MNTGELIELLQKFPKESKPCFESKEDEGLIVKIIESAEIIKVSNMNTFNNNVEILLLK